MSPYERKTFQKHLPLFLKSISMHEVWRKIDNINFLIDIAKRENLLNKENLFKFSISLCERYSYTIFDTDLHGLLMQASKKCFDNNTKDNQLILINAIKGADDLCKQLSANYGTIEHESKKSFNHIASFRIPNAEEHKRLNDALEQARLLKKKYNILKATKFAALFCFDSTFEDEIKAVHNIIEFLQHPGVSPHYNSDTCHLFREFVNNPFEAHYAPTTFREWIDRNICDRYHKFFFKPLYRILD